MPANSADTNPKEPAPDPARIRDLSDFCRKWPQLRRLIPPESLAQPEEARLVLGWLLLLADRVCLHFDE